MKKISPTTFWGAVAAAFVAVKPILDKTGYHLDEKTIGEVGFAVALAMLAYFAQDKKV